VRTPLGKGRRGGALAGVHPVDLLAHPLAAVVERTGIDPGAIEDVIAGCVSQIGEQSTNIARRAVLAAGYPERVPATTVDRQCGSAQQAIHFAAQGVLAGAYDVVVAAGVESMSHVPMGSAVAGADLGGTRLAERYPEGFVPQGISAELIAARWGIDRSALDAFALTSQRRAAAARDAGRFDHEIVPLKVTGPDGGPVEVAVDEGIPADPLAHHGGELVADHRRGRRAVDHQRRAGGATRTAAPGAHSLHGRRRRRPVVHAHRHHPGHP
jgi:acetyl-CoA acyltransferase